MQGDAVQHHQTRRMAVMRVLSTRKGDNQVSKDQSICDICEKENMVEIDRLTKIITTQRAMIEEMKSIIKLTLDKLENL